MQKKKVQSVSGRGIQPDSVYHKAFAAFSKTLRNRIINLRKSNDLTQEQMQDFEINLRQYQRIESGETKNFTLSTLFKIARALKTTPSKLIDV